MTGAAAQLVAVGVDDSDEAVAAADFAARLAEERYWDLMLVQARPLRRSRGPGRRGTTGADSVGVGAEELLDEVLHAVQVAPTTRVHRVVTASPPVETLRRVSGLVSVLVLGRRDVEGEQRLLTGRVAAATVAEARCPVVLVPAGWRTAVRPVGDVGVAVDEETDPAPVLAAALEEARRARTGLVVLRATQPDRTATDDGRRRASGDEPAATRVLGATSPVPVSTVEVPTRTVAGVPHAWIPDLPAELDLVVVGRPGPGRHAGTWSGAVVRAYIGSRACPVLVVPVHAGTS